MKLNAILKNERRGCFTLEDSEGVERFLDGNRSILASTNIDVTPFENKVFKDLESLGDAMNEQALKQLSHKLKQFGEDADSISSFADKFEMCHRGLIPAICVINKNMDISVLSFSDDNAFEYHVTTFSKMGNFWFHSYVVQSVSLHLAYPAMIQAQL